MRKAESFGHFPFGNIAVKEKFIECAYRHGGSFLAVSVSAESIGKKCQGPESPFKDTDRVFIFGSLPKRGIVGDADADLIFSVFE